MFYRGGIYRHDNCIDVDMKVNGKFDVRGYTKLKVSWVKQTDREAVFAENDRVIVERKDFKHWRRIV